MSLPRLAALLPLLGCADDTIGGQEKASVATVLVASQAAALSAEVLAHARLDLAEDATTCPSASVISGYTTLEWADCVPDRRWVRAAVDGATRLDLTASDVSTGLDALGVGAAAASGDLDASLDAGGPLSADLTLDGAALQRVVLDLSAADLTSPLTLSGEATVSDGGEPVAVTWAEVAVPGGSGCFVPTAGVATVEQGLTEVRVSFQPDGVASVTTSRGDSGTVDLCGLGADLWSP